MREDFAEFEKRNTVILVVGPENSVAFKGNFNEQGLPFIGLPDPAHSVLKTYGQQINLFKVGRMPAQALVNKAGLAGYVHYGHDMTDIPKNSELLALVDELSSMA